MIKDARPADYLKTVALDALKENYKVGKINAKALKALFKVVIDDTLYEISCVMEYIDFLNDQIKRLEKIEKYDMKRKKAKKEKEQDYYQEGMRMLFSQGETFDNYEQVLAEYREAVILRQDIREKLQQEIKIIKKLRV